MSQEEGEDVLLTAYNAVEDVIERRKLELEALIQAELARINEEDKRLKLIQEEIKSIVDPMDEKLGKLEKEIAELTNEP